MEKFRSAKMIREVLNLVLRWEEASSSAGYFKGMFEPDKEEAEWRYDVDEEGF
ncbi:Hypothetical protein FKW44_015145 [Caligus rogercresseyi]|uniref:Uncharacterized protein n=1 Tax=Caligus rogercresseyi TaxID=217165 RepID=A0A7T8K0E1_CALRO|nr:Hypothetical protein FKW44_015145 [Caligus rogercresseyi]